MENRNMENMGSKRIKKPVLISVICVFCCFVCVGCIDNSIRLKKEVVNCLDLYELSQHTDELVQSGFSYRHNTINTYDFYWDRYFAEEEFDFYYLISKNVDIALYLKTDIGNNQSHETKTTCNTTKAGELTTIIILDESIGMLIIWVDGNNGYVTSSNFINKMIYELFTQYSIDTPEVISDNTDDK